MTERVKRRTSKWDLKDDPDKFATGTRQDNASFGKASEPIHDNGSMQEWNSSKNAGSRNSKWSDTNSNSAFMPEGNSRWSRWEPSSGNRAEHKDDNDNRDFKEVPQNMKAWDSNRSYSTSMSPGLDEWRQRSRSRSPKRGWSKLHRSRSRSPLHRPRSRSRSPPHRLRSRSRSPPHGLRSRSSSPPHGLKRDSEGWNDRIRGESRVSVCNDFARGRCRRGSQCRFLHQDNIEYEGRRHSGSVSVEDWGSRHDRGESYGHPNNVERDYSRDKLFHGHDIQRNNRSSDRCLNFLKGSCHRGSSCRFIHESSVDDGRGTSERSHERDIRSYSGHEHRREPYRNNNTPCKYFAVGNCRKGINCKFSHEGAVHDRPEGGSGDDRRGHNLGDENKSWGGPKWSDEATDSAHGSAEGRSLNYGSSHIASTWDDPGWKKKQTWNDNEAATARPEPRSADERWGHNLGDQNKSWGGPKWGDETAGTANGSVEGRSVTDGRGCITDSGWGGGPKWGDEAAGRANGSVEGRPLNDGMGRIANSGWGGPKWGVKVADRPEAVSADEIRGHKLVDENKSWEGPKWGDEAAVPTDVSVEASSLNEERGQIVNNGCDQATDSEVKKFPQWGNDDSGGQLGVSDENQLLVDTKWTGSATESEVTNTSEWRNDENDMDVKSRIAGSWPTQRSLDDRTNSSLDDQNRPWGVPRWTDKPSDQAVHKFPPWASDNNSASMDVQLPRGPEEMLNFTNTPAGSGRDQYPHLIDNEKPTFGIQDPQSGPQGIVISHEQTSTPEISGQQHYPTVGMYPEGQKHPHPASTFMMHPAVSSMNAQGQQILLSPAPRVQNFDLNGPVEDVSSPNHQRLFHMGETTKEAGNFDPEMSPITPGASLTQNIVTSEQVAQISHLSASLAQIFGNSQQLPQLYATLNSTNPIGLVPPPPNSSGIGATVGFVPPPPNSAGLGASVGGSFVQSDQTTWSQQQYDPLSSMESSQISIHPLGFSDMPVKQNDTTDHELQASLQSSVPPSVVGGSNGDLAKNGSLEKTLHHQSNELRRVESVGNERAVDRVAKEQNPAHSGDTNADGRFDEDGKKIKDTKGMRIFKFALVEFVKEILKPTWKEGQLSKEAHKTVVKKVVDKVTGSVQGDHIPQTQEKIDQYLAYSKSKLTKLVEAYVEKYVKS